MTERKLRRALLNSIPIETERLILRYIRPEDAHDMYEYASLPEVSEFLLWSPHINVSATLGYIESLQKRYHRGLYGDWAVVLKENDKMIGTCGYANINTAAMTCEIGYVLSPEYWGKGYMTEAVNAVLDLSFEKLGFKEAVLRIIAQNSASIRLAKRCGFRHVETNAAEMEIKGAKRDIAHFSMTNNEYSRKKEAER